VFCGGQTKKKRNCFKTVCKYWHHTEFVKGFRCIPVTTRNGCMTPQIDAVFWAHEHRYEFPQSQHYSLRQLHVNGKFHPATCHDCDSYLYNITFVLQELGKYVCMFWIVWVCWVWMWMNVYFVRRNAYVGKGGAKHVIPIFGTTQVIQRGIWACYDSWDMTPRILVDAFRGTCCFYMSVREYGIYTCLQHVTIHTTLSVVSYDRSIVPSKTNSP